MPLGRNFVRSEFATAYTIIKNLTPYLGTFRLSERQRNLVTQARDHILGPAKQAEAKLVEAQRKNPATPNSLFANALAGNLQWYAIAYSVLDAILNVDWSTTPAGTLIEVALSGVRDDLVRDLSDSDGIRDHNPLVMGISAPSLNTLVWDVPNKRLLGKSPLTSVNRRDLEQMSVHLSRL